MKSNFLKLGLVSLLSLNLYCNNININNFSYVIPITPPKMDQVNTTLLLQQCIYDLEKLNEILKDLYNNRDFKFASHTAELKIKNSKSYYTTDYIKNLIKVLNGVDPYNDYNILDNQGYIRYVKDVYNDNYKMYKDNKLDEVISKDFDYIKNDIEKNLNLLSVNLRDENNIKPYLKNIFRDLINVLEQIKNETIKLKKLNVIKPFNKYIDYKYKIPSNWGQYNTTLDEMLDFILNGAHNQGYLGIKGYYNKFYSDDNQGFKIIQ